MKVEFKDGYKVPVKSWCSNVEESAFSQIDNLCKLPFAFHHVAIMPDCHKGFGMPIGGVLATKGVIIPNAVGKDISCGMTAINTGVKEFSIDNLKRILGKVRETIPVGMGNHRKVPCAISEMPPLTSNAIICTSEFESARKQISSLGSGNHFWELQKDEEGNLWIMIHSGSRNVGSKVATYYDNIAIALNEKYFSQVSKSSELAFLPEDSEEGIAYLEEHDFCLQFAYKSRYMMMRDSFNIVADEFNLSGEMPEVINIHHNFVAKENHFGQNVWVHRKGATQAYDEQIGIIPGSQGTHSYIVKGLGNDESFKSCSHGAGRKMSRTAAQKNLNLADEREKLDSQGILHAIRGSKDLDEASGAYKNIEDVMDSQKDLVKIIHTLQPLAVVKG